MSAQEDRANVQQDAGTWVWSRVLADSYYVSEVLNTPDWSEFDLTMPNGVKAVVRVEVKG
jgi:hypothetical protein